MGKMAGGHLPGQPFFPPHQLTTIAQYFVTPRYKNPDFLHQKYVIEGLSLAQISEQILSSKDAVRQGLMSFGIPIRGAHQPHGNPSQAKFGQQVRSGTLITNRVEQKVIDAVHDLKSKGMGLRQIARTLTQLGIETKGRGKRWHPQMVKRIITSLI